MKIFLTTLLAAAIVLSAVMAAENEAGPGDDADERGGGEAADLKTAALKSENIKFPSAALSWGDVDTAAKMPIVFEHGAVGSMTSLVFDRDTKERGFEIAGGKYGVLHFGALKFALTLGSKRAELKKKGASYFPMQLKLPDKRSYLVAFPLALEGTSDYKLYMRSGTVQKGRIEGGTLCFYDQDMDGHYDAEKDAFAFDGSLVFAPIPEYLPGRKIVRLGSVAENGESVSYTPYDGEAAALTVKFNGDRKLQAHFAMSCTEARCSFALEANGKPFSVVPGKYNVDHGVLVDAKKGDVITVITRGRSEGFDVGGKAATVTLGGPFQLRCDPIFESSGSHITFDPERITVWGNHGEAYLGAKLLGFPNVVIYDGKKRIDGGRMMKQGQTEEIRDATVAPITLSIEKYKGGGLMIELKAKFDGFNDIECIYRYRLPGEDEDPPNAKKS